MIQGITDNLKGGAPGAVGKNILHSVARGQFVLCGDSASDPQTQADTPCSEEGSGHQPERPSSLPRSEDDLDAITRSLRSIERSIESEGPRAYHVPSRPVTKKEVQELVAAGESLQAKDLSGTDLTKADLFDADLRLANLCDAVLRRVNLNCADLTGADLMRADLTGADCSGADFTEANLRNATLARCDLTEADLTRADLTDADLTGANLYRAEVGGAVVVGVKLDRAKALPSGPFRRFAGEEDDVLATYKTTLSGQQRTVSLTKFKLLMAGAVSPASPDERQALVGSVVVAVLAVGLLLWWLF